MNKIRTTFYLNANQIQKTIEHRLAEAEALGPGALRQSLLIEVARLQDYSDLMRWCEPSPDEMGAHPPGHSRNKVLLVNAADALPQEERLSKPAHTQYPRPMHRTPTAKRDRNVVTNQRSHGILKP